MIMKHFYAIIFLSVSYSSILVQSSSSKNNVVHKGKLPCDQKDPSLKYESHLRVECCIEEQGTVVVRNYFDTSTAETKKCLYIRGGSIFAGWNPFGYGITSLGLQFLGFDGSLDSDVGRFLASFKSGRKREQQLKQQWLEIVRVSKAGQSMRIYRKIDELLSFCVKSGFLS